MNRLMLEAKNIHKTYDSGKKELSVLKGIDLELAQGEFAAVTGPSGAGKSTLLHILGGLDAPTKGEVNFEGRQLYCLGDEEISGLRNKRIGFVFQFYHLLPEFTVLENVLMPALIRRPSSVVRRPLQQQAEELLKQVGLAERMHHFPSELSGGEKQRAAIVRGLINNPGLLLCDEPTGNLDSKAGEEIIALLKKINKENRMSVVLVTHNLELAKIADKVYHLRDGILTN